MPVRTLFFILLLMFTWACNRDKSEDQKEKQFHTPQDKTASDQKPRSIEKEKKEDSRKSIKPIITKKNNSETPFDETKAIPKLSEKAEKKLTAPNYLPEEPIVPPYEADRRTASQLQNRENYAKYIENKRINPLSEPVSTFSIDVDTGSYSNARRFLQKLGQLPPKESIRVEEFVNYFDYNYPIPDEQPFSIYHEMAESPFEKGRHLLHIGIQGKKIPFEKRPSSNLVFLLDVSGSMSDPDKLPLLKSAMRLLTDQMTGKDKISVVVYAGAAGTVLEPTKGTDKGKIKRALEKLKSGGSTAGAEGIELAYELAEKAFIKNGINRVILATDGDFNVGITNHDDLLKLIEKKRKSGIALTVLGFGMGNYNDYTMEQIANKGNGNYFYIDNLNEARKVLITELGSTLQTIAKDVKIQIEFNPQYVAQYRLIGYENRLLEKEDFDDDTIDAGEIGAGHTVTAIYEITMTDSPKAKELRYQKVDKSVKLSDFKDEICFFRLRYKQPDADKSKLLETPLKISEIKTSKASNDFLFSSAVAHFAQKLRESKYSKKVQYDEILKVVKQSRGEDPYGYRKELETLVHLAKSLNN